MFLENTLLVGVWAVSVGGETGVHIFNGTTNPAKLILTLLALFFGGLLFMGLYYR